MPTDKRRRQKEGRRARLEALRKQEQRRRSVRRAVWIVVIAGAIIATIIPFLPSTKPLTANQRLQNAADRLAVVAGCKSSPYTVLHPQQWSKPPAMRLNLHRRYYATFATTAGTFKVLLDPATAPQNVNSFVFLAEHHFYDCTNFDRVLTGFMNQGGNPSGGAFDKNPNVALPNADTQGPGYVVTQDEYPKLIKHGYLYAAGTLAVANAGPRTNGSQFFVMAANYRSAVTCPVGATNCLANTYTILGHVVSGLSVVTAINQHGGPPQNPATNSAGGIPPSVINRVLSVTVTST